MTNLDFDFQSSAASWPALKSIGMAELPELRRLLSDVDSSDPFARSPGYFAMTGRKGLWQYGDNKTSMLIARHPNENNQLLLFPPFGADPGRLLDYAFRDPAIPNGAKKIARIGEGHEYLAMRAQALGLNQPEKEDALDWIFPVHVISPANIVERKGSAFNSFRGHVSKAFREEMVAENIDVAKHGDDIRATVDRWARSSRKEGYSYDDLVSPTEYCLRLMESQALPLQGVVIYAKGAPVGFWIWDESDRGRGMATSMVRVAMPPRGSAEFGALKACETLQARGFTQFCQGGSETKGLDAFKRKLQPVHTVELKSILPARSL